MKLNKDTPLEKVSRNTKEKDQVKLDRHVNLVKAESLTISNNGSVNDFETKILKIVKGFLINKV